MATFQPDWTEGVELHASEVIAQNGSEQDDIDIDYLGYYAIRGQIDVTAATGASGDVIVELYGSCDSGSHVDTEASQRIPISFTAAAQKIRGFTFGPGPWVRVKVSNYTGQNVTYICRYAGLKQVSS